jgi:beta-phosphoglucomutase-like phosphatase (HAD superfamily)
MALRAVLFDLDGTLLDTERLIDDVVTAVVAELGSVYPPSLAA